MTIPSNDCGNFDLAPHSAKEHLALDAHVHFYPRANLGAALNSGFGNLRAAAQDAGFRPNAYGLLLTETARDHAFDAIASGKRRVPGWDVRHYLRDDAVISMKRERDGGVLLLFAGSQIVSAERIEVLALASRLRVADGSPLHEVLSRLAQEEIPAVLPWGVGKWLGARGRLIGDLLSAAPLRGVALGDNAGRPLLWPRPRLFARAEVANIPVLPGTDPLPTADAERGIGCYGCIVATDRISDLATSRPAVTLRRELNALRGPVPTIGARRDLRSVVAEQIALRRAMPKAQQEC